MVEDKRKGWLAELEVGSQLFVEYNSPQGYLSPGKVVNITPSGLIDVSVRGTECRHNQRGERLGYSGRRIAPKLVPASEKNKAAFRRMILLNKVNTFKRWPSLSTEVLEQIVNLIEGEGNENSSE